MNAEDMTIAHRGQATDIGGTIAKRRKEVTSVKPQMVLKDQKTEPRVERPGLQFMPSTPTYNSLFILVILL